MKNLKLKVLVLIPNYWGKGDTLKQAWSNVCKEACRTKRELRRGAYRVYVLPEHDEFKAYVDDFGGVNWVDIYEMPALCIEQGEEK